MGNRNMVHFIRQLPAFTVVYTGNTIKPLLSTLTFYKAEVRIGQLTLQWLLGEIAGILGMD